MANVVAISNRAITFCNDFVDGQVCESDSYLKDEMMKCLKNLLNSAEGRKFTESAWKFIKLKSRSASEWVMLCVEMAKPYLSDWRVWAAAVLITVLVGLDFFYFAGIVTATATAGAASMLRLAWPHIKEAMEKQSV